MDAAARAGSAGLLKRAVLSAAIASGGVIAATSSDADPTGFGPDPNALSYDGAAPERDASLAFRPDRDDLPMRDRGTFDGDSAYPLPPTPYAPAPAHDLYWAQFAAP